MPTRMKPTVLVVGGGFAGRAAVRALDGYGEKVRVAYVDEKPFFEFTPSILRCIVHPHHLDSITFDHDETENRRFALGRVTLVTHTEATVERRDGNRIVYISIPYDYCIWATGVSFSEPIRSSHTYNEPCTVQKRSSELERYRTKCMVANEILVVGGGPIGVELCAELVALTKSQDNTRITLACTPRGLLPRLPDKAGTFAEDWLSRRGVRIIRSRLFPSGVEDEGKLRYTSESDPSFVVIADAVFDCTGAKSNAASDALIVGGVVDQKYLRRDGSVDVRDTLQTWDMPHIFVAGDAAHVEGELDLDRFACEKTAYAAEEAGKLAALNVVRLMQGERLISAQSTVMKCYPVNAFPFGQFPRLFVISLYKFDGILCLGPLVICGKLPAVIKFFIAFLGVESAKCDGFWSFIFRSLEYITYLLAYLFQHVFNPPRRPAID